VHQLGELHICSSGVNPKEIDFFLIFEKIESEPVLAEKTALGLLTAAPLLWALQFLLLQSYEPSPRFQLAITRGEYVTVLEAKTSTRREGKERITVICGCNQN
jgi:hypothetical protein